MNSTTAQLLAKELEAVRWRCQQYEEIAAQTLTLLSVASPRGADCTEDKIETWHQAVQLCNERYALLTK